MNEPRQLPPGALSVQDIFTFHAYLAQCPTQTEKIKEAKDRLEDVIIQFTVGLEAHFGKVNLQ